MHYGHRRNKHGQHARHEGLECAKLAATATATATNIYKQQKAPQVDAEPASYKTISRLLAGLTDKTL